MLSDDRFVLQYGYERTWNPTGNTLANVWGPNNFLEHSENAEIGMPFYFSVYIGKETVYAQLQKVENSEEETSELLPHSSHVRCKCSSDGNHKWEFDENVREMAEEEQKNWDEIQDIHIFASGVTELSKKHEYNKCETEGEGLVYTKDNVIIKLADGVAFILNDRMDEAMEVFKKWKEDITWADITFCVYYDIDGKERKEVETWRMMIEQKFPGYEFEGVEYRRVSILYAWYHLQNEEQNENIVFEYKNEKFTYKHGVFRISNKYTGETTKLDDQNIEEKLKHMCTLVNNRINMARSGNSRNDSKYYVCTIGKRECVDFGDKGYWEKTFYLNSCKKKVSFVFLQTGSPTNKDGKWYHQLTFDLKLDKEEENKIGETVELTIISLGAKKGEYDRWKVCLWVHGLDKEYFKLVLIKEGKEKEKYVMSTQDIEML